MAAIQSAGIPLKKRNNYKLLVDPELKKGHKKLYRLNGRDEPGFPPCGVPKDPRTQKTVLGLTGSTIDYKVPRFKYDKFWEGPPPERDIFVIGLNESVRSSLFKEVCAGIGAIHAIKFHRHPKTKTFLGAATVSFVANEVGKKAVEELDGKVIGGCYLRAELDDAGDHLKKYLEPVLKKCGLDKKPAGARLPGKGSVSDSDDLTKGRTRSDSTAESVPDTTSDAEGSAPPTLSAATTPRTPTVRNDTLPNSSFPQLFQYSILNVETPPGEGKYGGFGSPVFQTPCTPSSIDSGISIRTHATLLSPNESKSKKPSLTISAAQPPLPPGPEESAPPLPLQDIEAPPPLPPLPPTTQGEEPETGGIENISSDEDKPSSPVFATPPPSSSPHPNRTAVNPDCTFDPSLGLKTLLADKGKATAVVVAAPPLATKYVASSSPRPAYELEVEEISGDESPVMVYFEPLKVESISDDEGGAGATVGGGDDMEISDNENEDNVIEVNVETGGNCIPAAGPMMGPHPLHLPPHHPAFLPGFFPPLPPPHMGGFPPFHPHHFSPHHMMLPPGPTQSPPPLPERQRDRSRRHYDSPPGPFIKDHQVSRPPNGYIGSRWHSSRNYSKSKVLRNFPIPKDKTESLSQDVLFKAIEQLRLILLNDVHKKIVESSAYPVLDSYWEKREKEKLVQRDSIQPPEGTNKEDGSSLPYRRMMPGMDKEADVASEEQKQRDKEEEEEEEEEKPTLPTPRKRLMNFKIPLVKGSQRRDQQQSVVARRRLFGEEQEEAAPPTKSRSVRYYSDISSSEDFSSSESDEEEEVSEEESEPPEPNSDSGGEGEEYHQIFGSSNDSDSDFEKFLANTKKRQKKSAASDISADEAKQRTRKPRAKRPSKQKKPKQKGSDDWAEDSPSLYRDKENLIGLEEGEEVMVEVSKPVPPKPKFKRRAASAELSVLEGFLAEGLDKEDVQMFKHALGRLKGEEDPLTQDLAWAHYPHMPPSAPPPTVKKRRVSKYSTSRSEEDHVTGCARSEGYYKIDMRDKVKYLPHHRLKNSTSAAESKKSMKSSGRVNRAKQRKLASLYSAGDLSSDLAKYNQFKARKKLLKFAKSTIHNWGLFAMESIPADEMVIEYVGQVVRQCVADVRERRYEAAGIGSSYLFRVDHDYIIDATKRGGLARFINHCCDPNCYAKVINFSLGKKIVIYSKRDIALGEEITYDYKFPIEDEKIPCLCGAPNCRGTLN